MFIIFSDWNSKNHPLVFRLQRTVNDVSNNDSHAAPKNGTKSKSKSERQSCCFSDVVFDRADAIATFHYTAIVRTSVTAAIL